MCVRLYVRACVCTCVRAGNIRDQEGTFSYLRKLEAPPSRRLLNRTSRPTANKTYDHNKLLHFFQESKPMIYHICTILASCHSPRGMCVCVCWEYRCCKFWSVALTCKHTSVPYQATSGLQRRQTGLLLHLAPRHH